jgi:cytochrome bd-type quinol oxidase subunit 1
VHHYVPSVVVIYVHVVVAIVVIVVAVVILVSSLTILLIHPKSEIMKKKTI